MYHRGTLISTWLGYFGLLSGITRSLKSNTKTINDFKLDCRLTSEEILSSPAGPLVHPDHNIILQVTRFAFFGAGYKTIIRSWEQWSESPFPLLLKGIEERYQRQPTTVFCKISVRRSKYCLELSITWGRLKICTWWQFHSCTIFEAYLINSLRFSEV